MKRLKVFLLSGLFLSCLPKEIDAQPPTGKNNQQQLPTGQQLSTKEQAIVLISAYTAQGNMAQLKSALNSGLYAGLTINEIKEVIVQLYAYAGFPRSLNALHSLMDVIKERNQKGIKDELGKEATPLPKNKNKLEFGTEMQTKLVGQPVKGEVYKFAPAIDQFLKEHLFGDIFGRDNLSWKTREIATISALASLGGVENQLRSHFVVGLYNGLSEEQAKHLVSVIQANVGEKEGNAASQALQTVLKSRQTTNETGRPAPTSKTETKENKKESNKNNVTEPVFPKGIRITNNNFTGTAWLQMLADNDTTFNTSVGNVIFEPKARTNWHYHPGGQILIVTGGKGLYGEQGKAVREIRKGDVIKCMPDLLHWHGAAPDSEMSHLAISPNLEKGAVVWLKPVTDQEYLSAKR